MMAGLFGLIAIDDTKPLSLVVPSAMGLGPIGTQVVPLRPILFLFCALVFGSGGRLLLGLLVSRRTHHGSRQLLPLLKSVSVSFRRCRSAAGESFLYDLLVNRMLAPHTTALGSPFLITRFAFVLTLMPLVITISVLMFFPLIALVICIC